MRPLSYDFYDLLVAESEGEINLIFHWFIENLSNGTHGVQLSSNGGVPVMQNGGPADVHNGLNGGPNSHSHISEGKQ